MSLTPARWVAALCLSFSAASAVLAAPPTVVAIVTSAEQPAIQIVGSARRTLPADEFAALRGEYRLSNGGTLAVEGARHRPVVTLNGRDPVRLVPLKPNLLVSADGLLKLEVHTEKNGAVSTLTLHVPAGLL